MQLISERLSGLQPEQVPRENLLTVTLSRFHYVARHRNAWHGFWSHNYFGARAFHASWMAAVSYERIREQGSRWEVCECPALVFRGTRNMIAVMELNEDDPLAHVRPREGASLTLRGIAMDFRAARYAYPLFGKVEPVSDYRYPAGRWTSRSIGGPPIRLQWVRCDNDRRPWLQGRSRRGLRRLVDHYSAQLAARSRARI